MNEGKTMMRRVYGLVAMLLCFGLVSFVLAGCFGGGSEPTVTPGESTVSSSDTTLTDQSTTTDSDTSTSEGPVLVDGLPREYVESLGNRPIVVLFYVPGGIDDEKVLASVRESESVYISYTFLMYDYRMPDAYGDLAQQLEIDYPPHVVLLDRHGAVRSVWSGFVDKATLNQTLVALGRY